MVYINDTIDLFIEEIKKDDRFWHDEMVPKLSLFYKECIVSEIVRDNLGKGKKCKDPPNIMKAIAEHETKKKLIKPK